MFNQIRTLPSDTRKLSFLWWPEGNLSSDPVTYQMLVHIFGATSSPFCANYCLRRTATDNAELYDKSTVQAVLRAFYVDDCLASVDTVSGAIAMREQLSSLLSRGGFHITKWKSNSRDVIKSIPKKELASSVESMNLELTELPIDRALGIVWDMDKDIISFKWKERARPFTKRGILSIISSVYDPLGIVSPFLLQAKIMLQKLMRKGLGWDDPVPDHYREQWNAWQRDLPLMSNVHIERCIKPVNFGEVANVQLHHFSDASSVGYGCVSYIRLEDAEGRDCCRFLLEKSRLCPIKSVSIPRLELTAATLSVKVNSIIIRELDMNIDAVYFWTDSTTVLKYINNKTKRFHTFVANRIALIQSGSSTNQWKHVDSANNPADKATRSVTPKDFQPPSLWLSGPTFLQHPIESWPQSKINLDLARDDPEVKKEADVNIVSSTDQNPTSKLICRYSSWTALCKAVAWLLRIKAYLRLRACTSNEDMNKAPLSAEDIAAAETSVISFVQHQSYPAVFNADKAGKISPSLQKLRPFVVNQVMRVGGRLSQSPFPFNVKHPIIIPKGHVASLLIRDYHNRNGHVGPSHTLALLRKCYWIMAGGSEVRKIITKCVLCRKRNARPCEQLMADLPAPRVTPVVPPFDNVGLIISDRLQ